MFVYGNCKNPLMSDWSSVLIKTASPDGWVGLVAEHKAETKLRYPLHQSRRFHGIKARNELWIKPDYHGLTLILWHLTDLLSRVTSFFRSQMPVKLRNVESKSVY